MDDLKLFMRAEAARRLLAKWDGSAHHRNILDLHDLSHGYVHQL